MEGGQHSLLEKVLETASENDRLRGELEAREREARRLRGFARRFETVLAENAGLLARIQQS